MPINNLISIEFSEDELTKIDSALDTLEKAFAGKVVQLTEEESQRYGKLGLATENWSNMIYDDCQNANVKLTPEFIDQNEWTIDEIARDQLSNRATRFESLSKQVVDTNRLIGFDIHNTCHSVYNYVKYQSTQNTPGFKAYYDKWKLQFPSHGGGRKPNTDKPDNK